jgi:hypothetical protein
VRRESGGTVGQRGNFRGREQRYEGNLPEAGGHSREEKPAERRKLIRGTDRDCLTVSAKRNSGLEQSFAALGKGRGARGPEGRRLDRGRNL